MQLASGEPALNLTIKPNRSIGTREFACLLIPALLLPFAAGAVFAASGAWMVLPFAVVETTVVAFAVHWIGNMSRGYERFVIADQRFRIEIGGLRGVAKYEMNAAWVKVVERRQGHDYRLSVVAHGREIAIGRYMDIEGRRELAAVLREKLDCGA